MGYASFAGYRYHFAFLAPFGGFHGNEAVVASVEAAHKAVRKIEGEFPACPFIHL
jgi:hypothetical protein